MVKELTVWSGDHLVGQKRLIFKRGDPDEWCQSCLWAPKCKEKTFFQTAISRELNWRFLRELNCKPILNKSLQEFRKNGKRFGSYLPPPPRALKGPKVPGSIGLIFKQPRWQNREGTHLWKSGAQSAELDNAPELLPAPPSFDQVESEKKNWNLRLSCSSRSRLSLSCSSSSCFFTFSSCATACKL